MARRGALLAKITRPRLYGATERARLFARLDQARARQPAVCVVGPPGSGKTTLVANWLEARALPGIWYQVDAGDSDLATFFYYLGEAAIGYAGRRRRMPLLTPEYREDLSGFSRRFFRELFARLPRAATLVLDNYEAVPPDEVFHELVAESVAEVPDGITLMVVSRRDPPETYARIIANERVGLLDWDDLRLTFDETRAIAAARLGAGEAELARLHEQCGGWVAGLTLLLQAQIKHAAEREPGPGDGREAIFDYFAGQIFAKLPQDIRRFLMATACLQQISPSLAAELVGEPRADAILRDLYKRHLFTHRRPGEEPVYWYHALFRSFLLNQAERYLSAATRRSIRREAGGLLERSGAFEDAFELYSSAEEWDVAANVVLRRAESLLLQGRSEMLCDWIEGLPAGMRESQPWLAYWLGAALLASAPARARVHLQHAFRGFSRCSDRQGQLEAAAGIIQSYFYDWLDLLPLSQWIEVIAHLLTEKGVDVPVALQLKAHSSAVMAMLYRHPGHPMLAASVDRVEALLDIGLTLEQRVTAATFLVGYHTLTGDLERAERVVARIEPLAADANLPPVKLFWWMLRVHYFQCRLAAYDEAKVTLGRAREIAEIHGLQSLRSAAVVAATFENEVLANTGDLHTLERNIERLAAQIDHSIPMHLWWLEGDRDWFDLTRGKCSLDHMRRTIELAERAGGAYPRISSRILYAHALCLTGDRHRLPAVLEEIRQMIADTCFARHESELRLIQVFSLLLDGQDSAWPEALRETFGHCRQTRYCFEYRSIKGVLSALCAEALRLDIEPEYVKEIIARYRVTAPANATEAWPWRVKMYTLGSFRVLVDNKPLSFPHKTPKRLVALLKAIASSGRNEMPAVRLMDAVWPDQDGDSAYQTLAKSVQRLRHILGDDQAVTMAHGKVILDPARVWVDAFAFDAATGLQPTSQLHALQNALELYRGCFLDGEEETPWCLAARKRLRAKFISLVLTCGKELESTGDWVAATRCYSRAVEIESGAEEFWRRLRACDASPAQIAPEG